MLYVDVLAGLHYFIRDDFWLIKESSTRQLADMIRYSICTLEYGETWTSRAKEWIIWR